MASPAFVRPEADETEAPVPAITLLVCLPSRWKEFPGNLRAALQPGGDPLAIERALGAISPRWLFSSAVAHILIMAALVWLVPKLPLDLPVVLDNSSRNFTTIYYQAPSLPQMEDTGGSRSSSRSDGKEAFHPTQTIRISRGSVIRTRVVDAPDAALPLVMRPTANLLSIAQLPLPSLPQLQTQPVELQKLQSKITRPATVTGPQPAADLSRVRNASGSLPRLPTDLSSVPQLQAQPVELQKTQSKIGRPAAVTGPQPAADLSRVRNTSGSLPRLPTDLSSVPQLQAQPVELQKVQSKIARPAAVTGPQPATDLSRVRNTSGSLPRFPTASASAVRRPTAEPSPAEATRTGSTTELPAVVVSTQPGDIIAVPADGAPGSLAMSPQGRQQTGSGGETGSSSSARGADPAPGSSDRSSSENSHGAGISPARGSGGAATGAPNLSPGVTVRGGVVSLDGFGPKTPNPQAGVVSLDSFGPKIPASPSSSRERNTADPPRKPAPIVVVATGRSGGGLNSYGTFKSHTVYTVYFQTSAGLATLQFAEHAPSSNYKGDLTPPDALSTEVPPVPGGAGIVLSCLLDASGHVRDIRVVEGAASHSQTVVEAVRSWRFHPALSAGQPVAVDALIGIGMSVR